MKWHNRGQCHQMKLDVISGCNQFQRSHGYDVAPCQTQMWVSVRNSDVSWKSGTLSKVTKPAPRFGKASGSGSGATNDTNADPPGTVAPPRQARSRSPTPPGVDTIAKTQPEEQWHPDPVASPRQGPRENSPADAPDAACGGEGQDNVQPAEVPEEDVRAFSGRASAAFRLPPDEVLPAPPGCLFRRYATHFKAVLPDGVLHEGRNSRSRNFGLQRPQEVAYNMVKLWLDGAIADRLAPPIDPA